MPSSLPGVAKPVAVYVSSHLRKFVCKLQDSALRVINFHIKDCATATGDVIWVSLPHDAPQLTPSQSQHIDSALGNFQQKMWVVEGNHEDVVKTIRRLNAVNATEFFVEWRDLGLTDHVTNSLVKTNLPLDLPRSSTTTLLRHGRPRQVPRGYYEAVLASITKAMTAVHSATPSLNVAKESVLPVVMKGAILEEAEIDDEQERESERPSGKDLYHLVVIYHFGVDTVTQDDDDEDGPGDHHGETISTREELKRRFTKVKHVVEDHYDDCGDVVNPIDLPEDDLQCFIIADDDDCEDAGEHNDIHAAYEFQFAYPSAATNTVTLRDGSSACRGCRAHAG